MKRLSMSILTIATMILSGCDKVVYVNRFLPEDQSQWGRFQIFRMYENGANPENISNRDRDEYSPDVRHDGQKIVFLADGNRIHIMDIDGNGASPVPNAPEDSGSPRWSRGKGTGFFILFSHPASSLQSAMYRISPEGSGLAKITHPTSSQSDEVADSIDDKYIVFSRFDLGNNYDRDLYLKYVWDSSPEVNLTNSPSRSETLPVVSHNGKMLAYRVTPNDRIDVANFTDATSITVISMIDLDLPTDKNISGIDFSTDDRTLFVSIEAADVPGNLVNRKQEIFKVRLDGSHQQRLTNNLNEDVYPSTYR